MAEPVSLALFISSHRDAIMARCLSKIEPTAPAHADFGVATFLTQLIEELNRSGSKTHDIRLSSTEMGQALFAKGFTASGVVHTYGSICQSITDLAVEQSVLVAATDFRTMNRCLDDAIAGAVSAYTRLGREYRDDGDKIRTMHARDLLSAALTAFDALQKGTVGVGGATGTVLRLSLVELQRII